MCSTSTPTVDNFDNSANTKTAPNLDLDLRGGKPKFTVPPPTGYGITEGGFCDPQNYYHEWTMEHTERQRGDELAMRLDADIQLDTGWLDSLRVGVRRAERDQEVNWSTYNWGSVQPLWGVQDDEAYFLDQGRWADTAEALDLVSNLVGGGVFPGGTFIHPRCATWSNYQSNIAPVRQWPQQQLDQPGRAHQLRRSIPDSPGGLYCPVEQQKVTEDVDAAYVMLKFGGDDTKIGNVSVRGNIGVRFVKTDGHGDRWYPVPDLDAAASATAASPGSTGS